MRWLPMLLPLLLPLLLAGSAFADDAPKLKPSKFSKGPIDITTNAYGANGDAPKAPGIGDVVADFSLPRADGGAFRLKDELGKGEVLLIMYRGDW